MRIALAALCLLSIPALAEDHRVYDDPRIAAWSRAFLAGERDAAVAGVEKDLRSKAPHPLAAFVWTELHGDRLPQAWAGVKDDSLRRALTPLAEIRILYDAERYDELLARYPAGKAAAIEDLRALTLLSWAAQEVARHDAGLAYAWAELRRAPDLFAAVWTIYNLAESDERARAKAFADLTADAALAASPAGRALKRLVERRPLGTHEKIRIADAFLALRPGDVRALRFRTVAVEALKEYDDAAATFAQIAKRMPFRNRLGWKDHAQALVAAERYDDAQTVAARAATLYGKHPGAWFARALVAEGHLGKAREVLDAALAEQPDHAELRGEYARLEIRSKRYVHAIPHARAAARAMPGDRDAQERLVLALRRTSGEFAAALAEFERLDKEARHRSDTFFEHGIEILAGLDRAEDAVAVARRAVEALPGSLWAKQTLANLLGDTDEARTLLQQTFAIAAPSTWTIKKLRSFGDVDDVVAAQRRAYPWRRSLWADLANQAEGHDARLAVWREAARANPGRHWPYEEINTLLVNAGKFDEALAECARALEVVRDAPLDDRVGAVLDRLWTYKQMLYKRAATASHLEAGLKELVRYRELGAREEQVQSYRAQFLAALGRRKEAGVAYLRLAELEPTIGNVMGNLFEKQATIGPRKWVHVRRCVERDPYDGERLSTAAERHMQWGGGTIAALGLYELLKERAPDVYRQEQKRVAKTYGALGAHVRHYREKYGDATAIASSARYIDWYDHTRLQAQGDSARVTFDAATGTATIVHPDGRVERRREHPVTGTLAFWQIGAASIEVDYDERHLRPKAIRMSSGETITFERDERGEPTSIKTSSGRALTCAYGSNGKPARIEVAGVGTLTIEYDAQGEMTKLQSPGGHKQAMKVAFQMQRILEFENLVHRGFRGKFPELPHADDKLATLEAEFEQKLVRARVGEEDASLRRVAATAGLQLAEHLVAHVADAKDHGSRATRIVQGLLAWHERSPDDAALRATAVRAALLWHRLLRTRYEAGLPREQWLRWDALVNRMEEIDEAAKPFLAAVRREPLALLPAARWLPRSPLVNRGFWRRYAHRQVVPTAIAKEADLRCALVRGNGDVVVGTGAGLSVLRRGYWEWFGFDDKRGVFSASIEPGAVTASSEILALAESDDGTLWIGTATGLVSLETYDGAPRRWRTAEDGLPTPRVEHLTALPGAVLIGGTRGLFRVVDGKVAPVATFAVRFAKGTNGIALVGGPDGLYACGPTGDARKIVDGAVDDALWLDARLLVLDGTQVFAHAWDGEGAPGARRMLRGQQDIVFGKVVSGLAAMPEAGAAVLTDQGISIHRDEHFEHLSLPLADRTPGVHALATRGGRTFLLTSDGVYAYERGQVMGDARGAVHALLGCNDLGKTFVARGDRLEVVDHAAPENGAVLFDRVPARHLARAADGALLVAVGTRVLRYANGARPAQVVFDAEQTVPEGHRQAPIRSLLPASDGSIWVAAGASVFRFNAGALDEFSIYKDEARFPARSNLIARVVETKDRDILAVASNEAHLHRRGRRLVGGVLRFAGDRFEMTDLKRNSAWFLSSYTRVGADEAIVGTAHGFARHRGGRYASFASLNDTSYARLLERTPQLFLGTPGAKLGEDVWLFGTGGGVVAWRAGQWFYPDRINWMLPDPHLALYGSRHVHAVATDAAGRVYAGTDRGLLIYDSGGGDAVSFLVSSDLRTAAFVSMESDKLQREADILLTGLKPGSAMARTVKRYRKSVDEIVRLEQALETGVALGRDAADDDEERTRKQAAVAPETRGKLKKRLASRERAHRALLARLERENLGLFQMLELKPLDLAAVRKKLTDRQAVVQYLPTPRTLFVHVVKRDSIEVREVKVASKELFERTKRAAWLLEDSGRGLNVPKATKKIDKAAALREELTWLYDQLLRPVEHELEGLDHVFVVPAGPLTYVPFGGLVRTGGKRVEYAVERFTFGVLPSMYLLHLALSQAPSTATDALILGDPDGSLPGARKEAREVHELLAGGIDVQIGDEATLDNLRANAGEARIVHFATHGKLDHKRPEQSYLLLAGGFRLGVLDIQDLPLAEADLVVLSACQTGIGKEGMEFATLARAFAHAGVPTTVATLWSVNDVATRSLMQRFYGHLTDGDDIFVALAKAQREAIAAGGKNAAPAKWSGFLPFGRP